MIIAKQQLYLFFIVLKNMFEELEVCYKPNCPRFSREFESSMAKSEAVFEHAAANIWPI